MDKRRLTTSNAAMSRSAVHHPTPPLFSHHQRRFINYRSDDLHPSIRPRHSESHWRHEDENEENREDYSSNSEYDGRSSITNSFTSGGATPTLDFSAADDRTVMMPQRRSQVRSMRIQQRSSYNSVSESDSSSRSISPQRDEQYHHHAHYHARERSRSPPHHLHHAYNGQEYPNHPSIQRDHRITMRPQSAQVSRASPSHHANSAAISTHGSRLLRPSSAQTRQQSNNDKRYNDDREELKPSSFSQQASYSSHPFDQRYDQSRQQQHTQNDPDTDATSSSFHPDSSSSNSPRTPLSTITDNSVATFLTHRTTATVASQPHQPQIAQQQLHPSRTQAEKEMDSKTPTQAPARTNSEEPQRKIILITPSAPTPHSTPISAPSSIVSVEQQSIVKPAPPPSNPVATSTNADDSLDSDFDLPDLDLSFVNTPVSAPLSRRLSLKSIEIIPVVGLGEMEPIALGTSVLTTSSAASSTTGTNISNASSASPIVATRGTSHQQQHQHPPLPSQSHQHSVASSSSLEVDRIVRRMRRAEQAYHQAQKDHQKWCRQQQGPNGGTAPTPHSLTPQQSVAVSSELPYSAVHWYPPPPPAPAHLHPTYYSASSPSFPPNPYHYHAHASSPSVPHSFHSPPPFQSFQSPHPHPSSYISYLPHLHLPPGMMIVPIGSPLVPASATPAPVTAIPPPIQLEGKRDHRRSSMSNHLPNSFHQQRPPMPPPQPYPYAPPPAPASIRDRASSVHPHPPTATHLVFTGRTDSITHPSQASLHPPAPPAASKPRRASDAKAARTTTSRANRAASKHNHSQSQSATTVTMNQWISPEPIYTAQERSVMAASRVHRRTNEEKSKAPPPQPKSKPPSSRESAKQLHRQHSFASRASLHTSEEEEWTNSEDEPD